MVVVENFCVVVDRGVCGGGEFFCVGVEWGVDFFCVGVDVEGLRVKVIELICIGEEWVSEVGWGKKWIIFKYIGGYV